MAPIHPVLIGESLKLNFLVSLFALTFSAHLNAGSPADEKPLFTVTPLSENQILVNHIAEKSPGHFEVTESLPMTIQDGPWDPEKPSARLTANAMVAEQLQRINKPARSPIAFIAKTSSVEKLIQDYDLNMKRENPCPLDIDRTLCLVNEPIYSFGLKYTHPF